MRASNTAGSGGPAAYRVIVVRHGGVAGMPITYEAETEALSGERADRLRRLVDATGILRGGPAPTRRPAPRARDLIEWSITVHAGAATRRLTRSEDALDEALAELIAFVRG